MGLKGSYWVDAGQQEAYLRPAAQGSSVTGLTDAARAHLSPRAAASVWSCVSRDVDLKEWPGNAGKDTRGHPGLWFLGFSAPLVWCWLSV